MSCDGEQSSSGIWGYEPRIKSIRPIAFHILIQHSILEYLLEEKERSKEAAYYAVPIPPRHSSRQLRSM